MCRANKPPHSSQPSGVLPSPQGEGLERSNIMTKLKICGLTQQQDIDIVNSILPDYIGFVFAESKRRVTTTQASAMKERLDSRIKAVAVFVNAGIDEIAELVHHGVIDLVQLHGDEDEAYIKALKRRIDSPIIKAIRVRNMQDILASERLPCDYLLLDAYKADAYGGTGTSFDYTLIPMLRKPFFLAGGLNAGNIKQALEVRPYCLDISSGVETNGVKDPKKIKDIIRIIREERI
jgi:phosphoribosylanthranilate isomerase